MGLVWSTHLVTFTSNSSAERYLPGIESGLFRVVLEGIMGGKSLLVRNLKVIQKPQKQDKGAVAATLQLGQTWEGGGHEVTVLSVKGHGASLRSVLKLPRH